jgi:hypothetical protein
VEQSIKIKKHITKQILGNQNVLLSKTSQKTFVENPLSVSTFNITLNVLRVYFEHCYFCNINIIIN